ncbi:TATE DNA Transposon [Leptomonas pyrrhocoris]|uniref:TATE DNA Transposon n=1 Tax=Leptomonas pyrrhocoris TaxID=157538 RepID=A0A0M9FP38_LEPPY|nr:TATE DNA Transposon [Leptomonas pyrrhocoris]KPA73093.1 TATE DNA Transposon [Leptomonas pyrrhocoris]|eukprot:XP_015651532.1 TATE DNA Transposon [Leptomonas pyrrhocoris]
MEGRDRNAQGVSTQSYKLTQVAGEAVLGLYTRERLGAEEDLAEAERIPPRPRAASEERRVAPIPVDAAARPVMQDYIPGPEPPPDHASDDEEEGADRRAALRIEPTAYLNWQGRHNEAVGCPREWVIYSQRPRHVSQLAWAAVTPDIRNQHIRWLRELKAMPADLLRVDLATAAATLVTRIHRARRWQWSTHTKALSKMRAALYNLPLYTNVQKPYDVTQSPEWRAAVRTAHRFERETPANPPPPITIDEYRDARDHLCTNPLPRLFLSMMWAFAARAGDIGQLRVSDVHLNPSQADEAPSGRLSLTVRRGKGARFRGPYTLASHLHREDLSVLQPLMLQRGPQQLLFAPLGPIKDSVRAALRFVNAEAALPSIRKGATRCLAASTRTEEEVMRLTGHTRNDTLQRYLGYGRHLTAEAVIAQDNAARVLLAPRERG